MSQRKITETTIGGNYTWYDTAVENEAMEPLLYCIGCAFPARDRHDYWYYIPRLFDEDRSGDAGGDPTWHISRFTDEAGRVMYSAEYETFLAGVEPPYGEYDEATVKRYFAKTMREYARAHPECNVDINQLIQKYRLDPSQVAN